MSVKKKWCVLLSFISLLSICAGVVPGTIGTVSAAVDKSSPLYGKTALFCGDSISYGQWDREPRKAWAGRIADQYGMTVTNASVGGTSISDIRVGTISEQLLSNKNKKFDYVILQGGVNDAWGNVETGEVAKVGKMSDSFDSKSFDTKTFAGGLEDLFYRAWKYFPDAKIGFIYTFSAPTSGLGRTGDMEEYYAMADKICKKWDIQVLDLYRDRYVNNELMCVNTNTFLMDALHPNAAGYDRLAPYIGKWMERLTDRAAYKAKPFTNQRALFLGDSISYGYADGRRERLAWAGRMQDDLGIVSDNRSISGLSLSTIRAGRIVDQLKAAPFNEYEYVIMQGGINDAWGNNITNDGVPAPKGTMSKSYDPSTFDTSTFAGALEELFFNAYTRFPSAKLGYIINFKLYPDKPTNLDMRLYDDVARDICKKWKVSCYDMHNDAEVNAIMAKQYAELIPDTAHPSKKGYDVLTPFIEKWFATVGYANISNFQKYIPTSTQIPTVEELQDIEKAIDAIGTITEQNWKSKKEALEWAEELVSDIVGAYGAASKGYVTKLDTLNAAREAYNILKKGGRLPTTTTKATGGKATKATGGKTTAASGVTEPTEVVSEPEQFPDSSVVESSEDTSATEAQDPVSDPEEDQQTEAKKSPLPWLIPVIAVAVAALAVGAYFLIKKFK